MIRLVEEIRDPACFGQFLADYPAALSRMRELPDFGESIKNNILPIQILPAALKAISNLRCVSLGKAIRKSYGTFGVGQAHRVDGTHQR